MSGETDLSKLLREMKPIARDGDFVFCTVPERLSEIVHLAPEGCFWEAEGLTLILRRQVAENEGFPFGGRYRLISLGVPSSLKAVGFLAEILKAMAKQDIAVNPVSAYYHDHLFVPADRVRDALRVLRELSEAAAEKAEEVDSEGGD